MKILNKAEEIEQLLIYHEGLRDDYLKLMAEMWRRETNHQKRFEPFFELLESGVLSHPESIMRARRKLQADNPELRGKHYKERKTIETAKVLEELGYTAKEPKLFPEYVSNCCGALMPHHEESDVCPKCYEHSTVIKLV